MACAIVNTNQIFCLSFCVVFVQWPWPLVNRVLWWSSWWFRWLLSSCYWLLELDCSSGEGITAISRCLQRLTHQKLSAITSTEQICKVISHYLVNIILCVLKSGPSNIIGSWTSHNLFVFGWTIPLTEIGHGCTFSFCSLTATWQLHQQKPFSSSMVCEIIH